MGVMWTTEQQRVIDARGCNILVSAAAGSGKTAVLVERIITMITDPVHPVDIDRLLIVTFTRAAAGEMRERIRLAIEKKLAEDEDNEHLQRQSTLLHHAQITTIDSFCSYVVKNYFHLIDLDPSYRMAEEGELRLMQGDVAAQVLDDAYSRKEPEFLRFVECFSTGKTDEGIEDMIKRLYTFSVSYPYPEEWLLSCKEAYHISSKEELEQAGWMQMIKEDIQKSLQEAMSLADAALDTAMGEGGPYYYENALQSDRTFIQKLLKTDSFEEWQKLFSGLAFARLSAKKDPQVSEEAKELTKNLRQQVKDLLGELREQYFSLPGCGCPVRADGRRPRASADRPDTAVYAGLCREKKRENILDFPDLEHFALKILVDHSQEGDRRTQAAKELAGRFAEVMIDEYQDSNFVQEKLLNAVSKMEDGSNNIFMVGDVKQSIYRFRLARPNLFMEKFKTYSTAGGDCLRIDLHKNFRSRREVLDGVNFLFYQIMGEALGKVEYDEAAALYPGASFPRMEKRRTAASGQRAWPDGMRTRKHRCLRRTGPNGKAQNCRWRRRTRQSVRTGD
ncbi:MAG: UvrD-helicase domain-containing protein [Blautia marasmi]